VSINGRDFTIFGECLVLVKGAGALAKNIPNNTPGLWELGLSEKDVQVQLEFNHQDLKADDFGPDVPAEVLTQLAQAYITMRLIHYDPIVLESCLVESMGGGGLSTNGILATLVNAGTMTQAGTPLGGGQDLYGSRNHYISLNLLSSQLGLPYRFRAAYLTGPPIVFPMGTDKSIVELRWRALPYVIMVPQTVTDEDGNPILENNPSVPIGVINANNMGKPLPATGFTTLINSATYAPPLAPANEILSAGALLYDRLLDTP